LDVVGGSLHNTGHEETIDAKGDLVLQVDLTKILCFKHGNHKKHDTYLQLTRRQELSLAQIASSYIAKLSSPPDTLILKVEKELLTYTVEGGDTSGNGMLALRVTGYRHGHDQSNESC